MAEFVQLVAISDVCTKAHLLLVASASKMAQNSSHPQTSDQDRPVGSRTSVLIGYATETGNSQDLAEEVSRMAERLRYVVNVSELNNVPLDYLRAYSLVIFIVPSSGQGEFPQNAQQFWRSLLPRKLSAKSLEGVNYALFGLGDSSYPRYNWAARKLNKRLKQLGANCSYQYREGNERHDEGIEGTFIPWFLGLRQYLLATHPLPDGQEPIPDDTQLPLKWILSANDAAAVVSVDEGGGNFQNDTRPIPETIPATVYQNDRITPRNHWQDVRHIILQTTESISYGPGDIVHIFPRNFPSDVNFLIKRMGWEEQADIPLTFQRNNELSPSCPPSDADADADALPFRTPPAIPFLEQKSFTLRTLLTDYLDINAIPRRGFFSQLRHYAHDELQVERLCEFADPLLLDDLWDYTSRPRRSILEVLHEFSSVRIPFQHVCAVFPLIRSRQFSVASGGVLKGAINEPSSSSPCSQLPDKAPHFNTRFDLLVAIVRYQTVIKRIRQGVCTRYISKLTPGSTMRIKLERASTSNLKPQQLLQPCILIGPGTGLAPLRSLIWERALAAETGTAEIGPTILFFGGRNHTADYFFREELENFEASSKGALRVVTAFSRDQSKKVYVQNRVREHVGTVVDIVCRQGGLVYVCGSSGRMPSAVREALIECFSSAEGGLSRKEAEEYLLEMERNGRYRQETW